MFWVFQMLMPRYTDGKSNFKVHILCRKLQLTSKIRIFLKIGWCLHACFVSRRHTRNRNVPKQLDTSLPEREVCINNAGRKRWTIIYCKNKINHFIPAVKHCFLSVLWMPMIWNDFSFFSFFCYCYVFQDVEMIQCECESFVLNVSSIVDDQINGKYVKK